MKVCTACKQNKSLSAYYKQSTAKDGFQHRCKSCANISSAASEKKKRSKYKSIRKKAYEKIRLAMWEYKEQIGCQHCVEKDPICLELHHTDPNEKDLDPSNAHTFSRFIEEAKKCIVLCSNCHKKEHRRLRGVD